MRLSYAYRSSRCVVAVVVLVAAALGVLSTIGCDGSLLPTIPVITPPAGTIYQYANVSFKFMSTQPEDKRVNYVVDWDDGTTDTSAIDYASGIEATLNHTWTAFGSYDVKAMALLADNPETASDWSDATTVTVGNRAPGAPRITRVGGNRDSAFVAVAFDPDGDSVAYQWEFDCVGGDLGDWTAFAPSGVPVTVYVRFGGPVSVSVKVQA